MLHAFLQRKWQERPLKGANKEEREISHILAAGDPLKCACGCLASFTSKTSSIWYLDIYWITGVMDVNGEATLKPVQLS